MIWAKLLNSGLNVIACGDDIIYFVCKILL